MHILNIFIIALTSVTAFRSQFPQSNSIRGDVTMMADKVALVANGKRVEVDSGSSMLAACMKLGLKVPLDCKKGDCGTCTVTVGGNKIRACVGKVPNPPKLKSIQEKGLTVTVDN
eukprot:gene1054-2062_t